MIWWAKKKAKNDEAKAVSTIENDLEIDTTDDSDTSALSALSDVLRAFGTYAFDTDVDTAVGVRATFEAWATKVATRSLPHLGDAVVAFVKHREAEGAYANRTLADLRAMAIAFVQTMGRIVASGDDGDDEITGHLQRLRDAAEKSAPEDLKTEALSISRALVEVLQVRRTRQRAELVALGAQISSLGQELEDAKKASSRDPLTGLLHRGSFDEVLERSQQIASLFERSSVLILVDADHFKRVNDSYGHVTGDVVLRALARCLQRTFLRKNDFVARYGGEEFAIVLRDTEENEGPRLAERARQAIEQLKIDGPEGPIRVTASLGVAASRRGDTQVSWLERADKALYKAKAEGRNRVELG
jgi:diguanylate cyclase